MNKLIMTAAAAASLLAAGAASAQTEMTPTPAAPSGAANGLSHQQFANLRAKHAFGAETYSAYSRDVGPGSVVDGYPQNPMGNANSGLPANPLAPSTNNVNGGN